MKTLAILAGLIASIQLTLAGEAVPRIGILSDAGARTEADLLMIELQKAKCELVERDEINKVLGEQTWQSILSRAGSQRIGRLLKADGLVLVTSTKPGQMHFQSALIEGSTQLLTTDTNQTLTVRLVAVAPGVVTWHATAPASTTNWAAATATTLAEFFPKLTVTADAATPVSVLRVRPTNGYASSIQLANRISPLLWQRLAREPSLFVLDRENLDRVVEEAQWNGQEAGFWAGSVLVEGRASHDLANTNGALLTLTVQRPVAGTNTFTRTEWTETGELTDLLGLVDRAATRLRQEIGARVNNVLWDPQAEGRRLLSIVQHLVDPRQQKAAIGTAMALGCRDIKTANEYRMALRSIAYRDAVRFSDVRLHLAPGADLADQARDFLELIRFHNDYRPPGGWDPNYKSGWHPSQESEWMFAYFQPLNDIHTFLDGVKAAKRQGEISATIAEIQAALRETATRLLAIDPYYQNQIPLHGARYRYTTTGEILDTYRRFLFPPKTAGHYQVIGSTGGLWYLERSRAEPLFPDHTRESAADRDRCLAEFEKEIRAADRPDVRLNIALLDLQNAKTPADRHACRQRLQTLVAELRPRFRAANRAGEFGYVWRAAYPGVAGKDPATREELQADARHAWETFVAVTVPHFVRPTDLECLVRSYLSLLSGTEARFAYRQVLEFRSPCAGKPNCWYSPVVDAPAIQAWLRAAFPAVLDDPELAALARGQEPPPPPPPPPPSAASNPLIVSNATLVPVTTGGPPGQIVAARWHAGHFQILWGELFCDIDLATRASEQFRLPPPGAGPGAITQARWLGDKLLLIRAADHLLVDVPGRACQVIPPPPATNAPGDAAWTPLAIAGADALVCAKPASLGLDADRAGTSFAWRLVAERDWHTTPLAFPVGSVAYVAGKFYFTTGAPRIVVYQSEGVIEFDPATGQSVTLRAPGTPLERRSKGKPLTFGHLHFGYGAKDGLLLGLMDQRLYGWDPVTKTVRDMNLPMPMSGPTTRFDPVSSAFGFELGYDPAAGTPSLARSAPTATTHELSIRRVGRKKAAESVPLAFPEPDTVHGLVYPGQTSLLVPCRSRYAFYEIPYADIQQWLAANPPAADKPGPNAPAPPATETK
jgi:hypothetical protein